MAVRPKVRRVHTGAIADSKMAQMSDDIARFAEFQQEILPWLRQAIKRGASAEEIYSKSQALAAARSVSIAVTDVDSSRALAACRDILDRAGGKAKERVEHTHKYSNLTDDELDAMLLSEVADETPKEIQ